MRPRARRKILRLGLAAAVAVSLVGCAGEEDDPLADRVILVGVDGLDWRIVRPLIENGSMPNLARFVARGASGELDTLLPTYSPNIWASVATGKLPRKHGIQDFVGVLPSGQRVPITSNVRRVKALWNILGEAGLDVAVLGWWTTWPAEPVRGVMVSDRMLFNRFNLWLGLSRFGADLPAQTYPPELFDQLEDLIHLRPEIVARDFRARFPEAPERLTEDLHDPWYELFLVFARDRAYRSILQRVLERETYDFVAFYLNGPDVASHYFWKYRFAEEWPEAIPDEELVARRDVIERYYSFADEIIGELLEQADERCLVILVSDHGFVTGHRPDSPNISGVHWNSAPPGVIAMAGSLIAPGTTLERGSVLDLTPIVLHALGLAVGQDMDGRVPPAVARLGGAPVRYVESYEDADARAPGVLIPTEHDSAIIERLEALGYVN